MQGKSALGGAALSMQCTMCKCSMLSAEWFIKDYYGGYMRAHVV